MYLAEEALLGRQVRLPTEAEWEYAARGGKLSQGCFYSGSNNLDSVAWYAKNSGMKRQEVGKKLPNELGIHDLSGNVWEWCWDWYRGKYYPKSPESDPRGAAKGRCRVLRGGSWDEIEGGCLVAHRGYSYPRWRHFNIGFRVVRASF